MDRHRGTYNGSWLPFVVFGLPILAVVLLVRGIKNTLAWAADEPVGAFAVVLLLVFVTWIVVRLRTAASAAPHWSETGRREQ